MPFENNTRVYIKACISHNNISIYTIKIFARHFVIIKHKLNLKSELELEGRSMKEGESIILTGGHYPKWSISSKIYWIQRLTLSHNLTDRCSCICTKYMAKSKTDQKKFSLHQKNHKIRNHQIIQLNQLNVKFRSCSVIQKFNSFQVAWLIIKLCYGAQQHQIHSNK